MYTTALETTTTINKIDGYLEWAAKQISPLFRGEAKTDDPLIPSIARLWKKGTGPFEKLENSIFCEFQRQAIAWLPASFHPGKEDKFEWLMLAQHHGVPTRLLDWTTNPLVALFFACEQHCGKTGVVYAVYAPSTPLPELEIDIEKDPFHVTGDRFIRPPHLSPRISAQSARFTVSQVPREPFMQCSRSDIRIAADAKEGLLQQLSSYGINHASLFPGLDGLGKQLAQQFAYWPPDPSC